LWTIVKEFKLSPRICTDRADQEKEEENLSEKIPPPSVVKIFPVGLSSCCLPWTSNLLSSGVQPSSFYSSLAKITFKTDDSSSLTEVLR